MEGKRVGLIVVFLVAVIFALGWCSLRESEADKVARAEREHAAALKEREASFQREQARRAAQNAAIMQASDDRLIKLFSECEARITSELEARSKPAFAVYFPDYSPADFDSISAVSTGLGVATGRPSTLLNQDGFRSKRIEKLRSHPYEIALVVESASDSFTGVKKWAAVYECSLDGLNIKSVSMRGSRQFFN